MCRGDGRVCQWVEGLIDLASLYIMYKERPPAPQTRLDDLLKRQAETLSPAGDTWKSFRSDMRSTDGPTRKIDELKAMNRQGSGARSPNRSFLSGTSPYSSPLRERLGLGTQVTGGVGTTLLGERRYQSPGRKARDKFEAFYESLKMQASPNPQPEKRPPQLYDKLSVARLPMPPRSPTGFNSRIQSLLSVSPKRSASPPPADDLSSILALDSLLQAKEIVRRTGLKDVPPTYLNALRVFAEMVARLDDSEDN